MFVNRAVPVKILKKAMANRKAIRNFPSIIFCDLITVESSASNVFFSRSPARLSARIGTRNVHVRSIAKVCGHAAAEKRKSYSQQNSRKQVKNQYSFIT